MTTIETFAVLLGAFVIVSAWRFAYRFVPWVYGASLTGLLWGDEFMSDEPAPLWTILVRLTVPLACGAISALAMPQITTTAAILMGALAGLLVCWPNILEPYRMPPALWARRSAVYLVYGMFTALCGLSSFAGARLIGFLFGDGLSGLSAVGLSILSSLVVALVLWVVKVAWATRGIHGDMWRDSE